MQIAGIIPARFASTRYPGKPLVDIFGKSMIQRVYEQAASCSLLDTVVVATDDDRIAEHVAAFGGRVTMTLSSHISGTERVNEAVQKLPERPDAVVNIQGDEPYVAVEQLSQIASLIQKEGVEIATLVKRIEDTEDLLDPNKVKVVMNTRNQALYFSRSPIPYIREAHINKWLTKHDFYKHLGLYAYRTEMLNTITHLEPAVLEESERLEQLRWLAHGKQVFCGITRLESLSVDTPEDLEKLKTIMGLES